MRISRLSSLPLSLYLPSFWYSQLCTCGIAKAQLENIKALKALLDLYFVQKF